jgi:hypothetical protein
MRIGGKKIEAANKMPTINIVTFSSRQSTENIKSVCLGADPKKDNLFNKSKQHVHDT